MLKNSKAAELEAKKKILERNKHLQELYKHLVASKLISAQDFWSEYYQTKDGSDTDKLGVSSGFLSSIAQSEGTNGVKLNLSIDTIQSIFRTYPAVERKHLELVPHEMTEQEFWAKFFQSHYFHREREAASSSSDPFSDCVRADDAEMRKLLSSKIAHKILDFSYIQDDSFVNDITSTLSCQPSSSKDLLVKRFNYHSERVLLTTAENKAIPDADLEEPSNAGNVKNVEAKVREEGEDEIMLESEELRFDKHEEQVDSISFALGDVIRPAKRYSDEKAQAYRDSVLRICETMQSDEDFDDRMEFDDDYEDLLRLATAGKEFESEKDSTAQLQANEMVDLQAMHDSVAELLKHFWMCFPPTTPEMEEKLKRMSVTLRTFEENKLAPAEGRFGEQNVGEQVSSKYGKELLGD
ncbi:unnamed protein product [Gongylonema pulchrum]|uniref:BSD domain-containing protein n=1 Tax=Gongylonema pulchrum TaxID=637853 RepID=A0A183EDE1_9BILA|nr:unnamed protein product [Gongylonema pulchrum]